MLFTDSYNEIKFNTDGEYKELGSKFISYAFLVKSKEDVGNRLDFVKQKQKSASHYCFAYVLNPDYSIIRNSDDGEPKYSAGKPMLTQLKKYNLTNILVVVVRYFGGKKLGIPGLIRSYKNATIDALQKSTIINKKIKEQFELTFSSNKMNIVMNIIKKYNIEIYKQTYVTVNVLLINVLKKDSLQLLRLFKENKIKNTFKKIV